MKFLLLIIKRWVEDVLMFPLIVIGRLIALLQPLSKEYKVFFFFPFYHTGGAEKVHALIAKATGNTDCIIFFTRKSHNDAFLNKFKESGCAIKDVSVYTDNKLLYFVNIVFRGMVSGYVNSQKMTPVVFNGQCNFGYKLSPWIKREIKQIELIHSISNFSYIRIPFLPFITETVMISQQKINEHLTLYKRFNIPERYAQRIYYIPNASEFERLDISQKDFSTVRVLYSGRATPEKRPLVFARIAEEVHKRNASVEFVMAGDDFSTLDKRRYSFIQFKGNIRHEKELAGLYKACNVVCITSSTEGFPLAVIEGMAYGCAVIATPVGDLPFHIKTGENGFLLSTAEDENEVVKEAAVAIVDFKNNPSLLQTTGVNNVAYAQATFSYERFAQDYKKLIYR